jgi:hypothetical protein
MKMIASLACGLILACGLTQAQQPRTAVVDGYDQPPCKTGNLYRLADGKLYKMICGAQGCYLVPADENMVQAPAPAVNPVPATATIQIYHSGSGSPTYHFYAPGTAPMLRQADPAPAPLPKAPTFYRLPDAPQPQQDTMYPVQCPTCPQQPRTYQAPYYAPYTVPQTYPAPAYYAYPPVPAAPAVYVTAGATVYYQTPAPVYYAPPTVGATYTVTSGASYYAPPRFFHRRYDRGFAHGLATAAAR